MNNYYNHEELTLMKTQDSYNENSQVIKNE